jgi:hypothetical protein
MIYKIGELLLKSSDSAKEQQSCETQHKELFTVSNDGYSVICNLYDGRHVDFSVQTRSGNELLHMMVRRSDGEWCIPGVPGVYRSKYEEEHPVEKRLHPLLEEAYLRYLSLVMLNEAL